MPQRFLRPGITDSEKWNAVPFDAQSLYIRLITLVDDYGRYDGRISVIMGHAFSVWNEMHADCQQDVVKVTASCQQLLTSGLVSFYESGGKKFLQLTNWQERARGKSKWPDPNDSNLLSSCCQNPAESCGILPPSSSPQPSPTPSPSGKPASVCNFSEPEPKRRETFCPEGEPDIGRNGEYPPEPPPETREETIERHRPPGRIVSIHDLSTPPFRLKRELNRIFCRPREAHWSHAEESALVDVASRPDWEAELKLLETARGNRGKYFPQSIGKLLDNWNGTLDAARNPAVNKKKYTGPNI